MGKKKRLILVMIWVLKTAPDKGWTMELSFFDLELIICLSSDKISQEFL